MSEGDDQHCWQTIESLSLQMSADSSTPQRPRHHYLIRECGSDGQTIKSVELIPDQLYVYSYLYLEKRGSNESSINYYLREFRIGDSHFFHYWANTRAFKTRCFPIWIPAKLNIQTHSSWIKKTDSSKYLILKLDLQWRVPRFRVCTIKGSDCIGSIEEPPSAQMIGVLIFLSSQRRAAPQS